MGPTACSKIFYKFVAFAPATAWTTLTARHSVSASIESIECLVVVRLAVHPSGAVAKCIAWTFLTPGFKIKLTREAPACALVSFFTAEIAGEEYHVVSLCILVDSKMELLCSLLTEYICCLYIISEIPHCRCSCQRWYLQHLALSLHCCRQDRGIRCTFHFLHQSHV